MIVFMERINKCFHFFEDDPLEDFNTSKRVLCTPSQFARQNLAYVQEIGMLQCAKAHRNARSFLDSFLFFVVRSGKGTLCYNGRVYHISAGDAAFIDCHNAYYHESDSSQLWELAWVHFNGAHIRQYYEEFQRCFSAPILHLHNTQVFVTRLQEMLQTAAQNDFDGELACSYQLYALLADVFLCRREKMLQKNFSHGKIEEVKNYIDQWFGEDITLDMLSEKFFISKYHLERTFKSRYGTTIGAYVIQRRITHAKELLRFSSLRISEIAEICGVADSSYFNKLFKKSEGITARTYRDMWREK